MGDLSKIPKQPIIQLRQPKRTVRSVLQKARVDAIDLDLTAAFWRRGMEIVSDIDDHRHLLARGDEEKNSLLIGMELAARNDIQRQITDRNNPLKGLI